MIPVSVPFLLGFKEGSIWVIIMIFLMSVMILGEIGYVYPRQIGYRFLAVFSTVTSLSCSMEFLRERYMKQLKKEKAALQKALGEIRLLKGMVPICASCKKIRNDEGFWTQIEHFMKEHSDLEFSHGICPDCATKLFPSNKKGNRDIPKYDV